MEANSDHVVVRVDPSCPFAWITAQWLAEVERAGEIALDVRLLSLSVVNEHRVIDPWYRQFNDRAWGPARVMAAVAGERGDDAARGFYEAFGRRFHVEHATADEVDRRVVAAQALAETGLPDELIDAADDARLDDRLRAMTNEALARVGLDVGVPLVEIDGVVASGPVITSIPRGRQATDLYRAVRVLVGQSGFVRLERQRVGALDVG
jgi:hypothetical protein